MLFYPCSLFRNINLRHILIFMFPLPLKIPKSFSLEQGGWFTTIFPVNISFSVLPTLNLCTDLETSMLFLFLLNLPTCYSMLRLTVVQPVE